MPKSPIHFPYLSSHPQKKALAPLIGLETGSVRMAKQIMPSKGVPFQIEDWPSIVLEGLRVLNENNWFPAMTLIVGNPGETDEDDDGHDRSHLRNGTARIVCVSDPVNLHSAARHADGKSQGRDTDKTAHAATVAVDDEVLEDEPASGPVQLVGTTAWRVGFGMWLYKLRRLNGPNFTWPLWMFSGAISEKNLNRMGKIYMGKPLKVKDPQRAACLFAA